jgi:predicted nucleic acid-binding protein
MARRVYFDTCVLNRPLDDQSQARIRLEAEAIEHLLRAVADGKLEWILSEVVQFEIARCPDDDRRTVLELISRAATEQVALADHATSRARELRSQGLKDIDALHLAVAEAAAVEVLLTTDDYFIRSARQLQPPSTVRVENPVIFETEVIG